MAITADQSPLPTNYISGASPVYNSASTVDIQAGDARDSTDTYNISWSTTLTADITSSGANGLDTGSEAADTWYALHVIADTSGPSSVASLLSTSSTAPTLPGTYNIFRFIGWVRNGSASDILTFITTGNKDQLLVTYDDNISNRTVLTAGSATTWAAVDLSSFVPPTSIYVYLACNWVNNATPGDDLGFRPTGLTGITSPFLSPWRRQVGVGLTDEFRFPFEMPCSASQSIDYETDISNTVDIDVIGYTLFR